MTSNAQICQNKVLELQWNRRQRRSPYFRHWLWKKKLMTFTRKLHEIYRCLWLRNCELHQWTAFVTASWDDLFSVVESFSVTLSSVVPVFYAVQRDSVTDGAYD